MSNNRKTVVVLENFWSNEPMSVNKDLSVQPFIDGVCRLHNYDYFYGRHVGPKGFDEWVENFSRVLSDKDRRVILYLAGHGSKRTLSGKKILTVLERIWSSSNEINIEGCILGACYAGRNTKDIKDLLENSSVAWVVGYKHAVDWLPSTLLDSSVIGHLLKKNDLFLSNGEKIASALREAVSLFNPKAEISEDKGNLFNLFDTLSCVIRPRFDCAEASEIRLFDECKDAN